MGNKIIPIGVLILFFLVMIPNIQATTFYNRFYLPSDSVTIPITTSLASTGDCNYNFTSWLSVNGTPNYRVRKIFESPGGTTFLDTGNIEFTESSINCLEIATVGALSQPDRNANEVYETRVNTSTSGIVSATASYGLVEYVCDVPDTNYWVDIYSGHAYNSSFNSYSPNGYWDLECVGGNQPHTGTYRLDENRHLDINACNNNNTLNTIPPYLVVSGCPLGTHQNHFYYPFRTGGTGEVKYNFTLYGNGGTEGYTLFIYALDDPTSTSQQLASGTALVSGTNVVGSLTLDRFKWYAFYPIINPSAYSDAQSPDVNISVNAYEPDWICTEYSECVDGFRSRTCTDPLNLTPDLVEITTSGCQPEIEATIPLGFEDFYSTGDIIRKCYREPWSIPFCQFLVTNLSARYPTNWTVRNEFNYNTITLCSVADSGECFVSDGSYALKMWTIPPYLVRPNSIMNATFIDTCVNSSFSYHPAVYTDAVNNETAVSFDLIFPSEYMAVTFDVKKCEEPILQYDVNFLGSPCIVPPTKQCYTKYGNCSLETEGKYSLTLKNNDTEEIILYHSGEATNEWSNITLDISDLGIQTEDVYQLRLQIGEITNPNYVEGQCVYFDNVKLQYLSNPIECDISECIGYDFYIKETINNVCVQRVSNYDPFCFPEEYRQFIILKQDFCINSTLWIYDNDTNKWLQIENAEACEEEVQETTLITPIQIINQTQLDEAGIGFVSGFATPIFLILLVMLFISGILSYGIHSKASADVSLIFSISMIFQSFVLAWIGLFPIELLIIGGTFTAFLVSKYLFLGNKGGG